MISLHMHSRYREDGGYSPAELAEQCRWQGVAVMSITGHNWSKFSASSIKTAAGRRFTQKGYWR